jgi:hypothetical protein
MRVLETERCKGNTEHSERGGDGIDRSSFFGGCFPKTENDFSAFGRDSRGVDETALSVVFGVLSGARSLLAAGCWRRVWMFSLIVILNLIQDPLRNVCWTK